MRAARAALAAVGAALLGYGAWLLVGQLRWRPDFLVRTGAWLVAGPPLHDALVAPVVTVTGLLLARLLPRPWRTAVTVGLVVTGSLLLVGLPLLTRPAPAPPNPGLDDRAYLPGLLGYLGVLWVLLLAATALVVGARRRARRQRADVGR